MTRDDFPSEGYVPDFCWDESLLRLEKMYTVVRSNDPLVLLPYVDNGWKTVYITDENWHILAKEKKI